MKELSLSVVEPFSSPAWGSNFIVFSGGGAIIPEDDAKAYLSKVCKYAKHFGVYLVPERFMLMGYQCMCLISPDGKVLGAQKALYLNLASRMGKRSSRLEVQNTEFGGIFLCLDVDIYHPEVCRIAAGMGAQIIICSQRIVSRAYGSHMVIAGVWNAAQLNHCYAVSVSNQFHCVCAPRALSNHGDGFIAPPNLKLPMTAKLDCARLSKIKARPTLNRKFYAIHREELLR